MQNPYPIKENLQTNKALIIIICNRKSIISFPFWNYEKYQAKTWSFWKSNFSEIVDVVFFYCSELNSPEEKPVPIHFFKVFSFHVHHKWNLCLMEHERIFSEILHKCKAQSVSLNPELPRSNVSKKKRRIYTLVHKVK